jgi:two-component system, OmpR family, sensor kinase
MTLRLRLLIALVALAAVGLLVSDVVVYTQLKNYLITQTDPQLRAASFQVERAVLSRNGLITAVPAAPPPNGVPTVIGGGSTQFPGHFSVHVTGPSGNRNALFPAGTVGELVDPKGGTVGKAVTFYYGGRAPSPPVLPRPIPAASGGEAIFSASSEGTGATEYRVLVRSSGVEGLSVVVAIPLTGVTQTTNRLALVLLFVSLLVLLGLGILAWWIVRRGLRPLEQMATTAGDIAKGDLGRRVSPADETTEVGRLGLALNTMLGEIEEAFAARSASELRLRRFLADASHELRTPLTSIRGYAEIFDLGARDRPEDLAVSMHRIQHEAERMNVLVDDLLLLARLGQERPVDLRPMDLAPVVARAAAATEAGAPGHRVELEVPEHAEVLGDGPRLRQVLDNLLANAVRHSPDGAPVLVRVVPQGESVRLEVVDRGPGVPPEDAERIFEAFYRSDDSRARVTGGAGLGLAIVAAIVREHGGSVGVEPAGPDGGARFWAQLRAATASPQADDSVGSVATV